MVPVMKEENLSNSPENSSIFELSSKIFDSKKTNKRKSPVSESPSNLYSLPLNPTPSNRINSSFSDTISSKSPNVKFLPSSDPTNHEKSKSLSKAKRIILAELNKRRELYILLHNACAIFPNLLFSSSPVDSLPKNLCDSDLSKSSYCYCRYYNCSKSHSSVYPKNDPFEVSGESNAQSIAKKCDDDFVPKYSCRLTRIFLYDKIYRYLLIGTSNFLILVSLQLKLSTVTICTALVYLHRFYERFRFEGTERKYVAGACLLLAWKYREDMESIRCNRKLFDLSKAIYRVLSTVLTRNNESDAESLDQMTSNNHNNSNFINFEAINEPQNVSKKLKIDKTDDCMVADSTDTDLNILISNDVIRKKSVDSNKISVSQWIMHDNGKKFNMIKDKIRLYEAALLRAIQYNIGPIPMAIYFLVAFGRKFVNCFSDSLLAKDINVMYHKIHTRSMLVLLDCYRTPFCLDYTAKEMAIACTWRAGILLNIPFFRFEKNFVSLVKNRSGDHEPSSDIQKSDGTNNCDGNDFFNLSSSKNLLSSDRESNHLHLTNDFSIGIFEDFEDRINKWLLSLKLKEHICVTRIRNLLNCLRCSHVWMVECH